MPAAPATAALPNPPDRASGPSTNPAAGGATAQPRFGCVLSLLRKLINYGQDLARTVQQRAAAGTLLTVALHFGTRDVALILARITRGLMLANALEARLISRPVRRDAVAAPVLAPTDRTQADRALADRTRRTARRAEQRRELPDVPTAEDIAAALRHRPAAAVIADICRDLGIVPAHPLWREVMMVLPGGAFGTLFKEVVARVCGWLTAPPEADADGWPVPRSQPAVSRGTGPP
jgi:hypothetical protein